MSFGVFLFGQGMFGEARAATGTPGIALVPSLRLTITLRQPSATGLAAAGGRPLRYLRGVDFSPHDRQPKELVIPAVAIAPSLKLTMKQRQVGVSAGAAALVRRQTSALRQRPAVAAGYKTVTVRFVEDRKVHFPVGLELPEDELEALALILADTPETFVNDSALALAPSPPTPELKS